jgi:hypothetical protein
MQFLDPRATVTPWPIDMKFCTIDYVGEVTRCAKNYNNRFSGVCSPYTWNMQLVNKSVYLFFVLFFDTPTARTGIATWTIMLQSTQIFSRSMCLLGVWIFAKKFLGVIFAPKNWKNFHHCTNMKFLNNFWTEKDKWKIPAKWIIKPPIRINSMVTSHFFSNASIDRKWNSAIL